MRRRLLVPLTWLAVTLAATTVTWLAVSSAIADTAERVVPAEVAATAGPATTTTTAAPAATTAPPTTGEVPPTTAAPPASTPHAGPPPTEAPPVAPTSRSFNATGGVVSVACDGDAISLLSASPQPGYRAEVKNGGPQEVEVQFEGPAGESEVRARCAGGQPVQTSSGRDGSDGG